MLDDAEKTSDDEPCPHCGKRADGSKYEEEFNPETALDASVIAIGMRHPPVPTRQEAVFRDAR